MCKTFPPNKREVCLVARAGIKVGSENRLLISSIFKDCNYRFGGETMTDRVSS